MKAFPVIIGIIALSTFCSVDAGLEPEYYAVLEGSKVILKCDYQGADPNQVLWVRGKLGVMSLDGNDFFTIARTLDPDLHRAYKIESDGRSSSLIMEDAALSDLQRQHPGLYKCVIDLYREIKYHVTIVKNDFSCRRVGVTEGTTEENTLHVGAFLDIECTITKDREPSGRLKFSLSVGDQVVQTNHVDGETLWKKHTTLATVRFKLPLKESYHGQSVHVAITLNTFTPEVGETQLKFDVAERLRLSYHIRVQCPPSQLYLKNDVVTESPGIVTVPEDGDVQRSPYPRPHCLIFSTSPFESKRNVTWQLKGLESADTSLRVVLSGDDVVASDDFTNETVYRGNITKSLANSLVLGNSTLVAR